MTFSVPSGLLSDVENVIAVRADDEIDGGGSSDLTYLDVRLQGVEVTVEEPELSGWVLSEERSDALVAYTVTHGRARPMEPTRANSATVGLVRSLLEGPIPRAGERFRITLSEAVADALGVPEDERPRFTGEITDHETLWADEWSVQTVVGVGRVSRLGRLPLDLVRPEESDRERVRRILRNAQLRVDLDVGTLDAAVFDVVGEIYKAGSVEAAIQQVQIDSLGQLVEHRSGRLDWHSADHRRDAVSAVTLTGEEHLIRPFRWAETVATIINDAKIIYGEAGEIVRIRDAASIREYDPWPVEISTRLATVGAASSLGSLVVGRYRAPAWQLPDVSVDLERTAGAQLAAILALSHGDKITASGLPPDGPFTAGDLFVEGTTEAATASSWRLSLAVSDPTISGAGIRWMDVPADVDWTEVDPALSWLDVATLTDPADLAGP